MKLLLLSLCLGAGLFFQSHAQQLKLRPFLGVQVQAIPDSVARANKLKSTQGAWVRRVVPNSTAAALKLQENDLIQKVNGKSVENHQAVVAMARQFTTGQP